MDLLSNQPIADRLTALAPSLKSVGFAADFAAVLKPGSVLADVAGFVIQTGAAVREIREGSGPLRQMLDVQVSVLTAVKFAGLRGAPGLARLETPIAEVRAALFGWFHPDAQKKFQLAGEGLEDFDAATGVLVYRNDFTAPVLVQEPTP